MYFFGISLSYSIFFQLSSNAFSIILLDWLGLQYVSLYNYSFSQTPIFLISSKDKLPSSTHNQKWTWMFSPLSYNSSFSLSITLVHSSCSVYPYLGFVSETKRSVECVSGLLMILRVTGDKVRFGSVIQNEINRTPLNQRHRALFRGKAAFKSEDRYI